MPNLRTWTLPPDLDSAVSTALREWTKERKIARLWARDARLWTGGPEAQLARLARGRRGSARAGRRRSERVAEDVRQARLHARAAARHGRLEPLARGARADLRSAAGCRGSPYSTRPIPRRSGRSRRASTSPRPCSSCRQQVRARRSSRTSSSSTSSRASTERSAPRRPAPVHRDHRSGSKLEQAARRDGFRAVFHGAPVDRRALLRALRLRHGAGAPPMGLDVARLLDRAAADGARLRRLRAGGGQPGRRARRDPRASARTRGRDKVTLVASPGIRDLGAWLEQLLAESTGKQGKGADPGRPRAARRRPSATARTACSSTSGSTAPDADAGRGRRGRSSAPGIRSSGSTLGDRDRRSAEFFRWEFATAVAGAIIGIDPFDQPDVEASKIATRELTDEYERTGRCRPRRRSSRATGSGSSPTRATPSELRDAAGATIARGLPARRTSARCAPATTSRCSPTSR